MSKPTVDVEGIVEEFANLIGCDYTGKYAVECNFLRTALETKDKKCEERVREERERIVNSRKFFIQVDEDNITIRPVILSPLHIPPKQFIS